LFVRYNVAKEADSMRALVTGATGLVGRRLLAKLDRPVVLSRDPTRAGQTLGEFEVTAYAWDPAREAPPVQAFENVEVVFHLAGESIAEGRWTAAKKRRLRDSRVAGTRNLVATLRQLTDTPRVLISASAIGYYGDRDDEVLTESSRAGEGFLPEICIEWEGESQRAVEFGMRVVNPRIGIVLSKDGGALAKMLPLFRSGMASPLGKGRQWVSWIHQEDLVRLLMFAAEQETLSGPVNATAPGPVTNRDFTNTLASVLHRPAFLPPVPRAALLLTMGEFANVLLESQRVSPSLAEQAGYRFEYPDLRDALANLLASKA
jgi:uncharacterized protein (TIGR01777 family)